MFVPSFLLKKWKIKQIILQKGQIFKIASCNAFVSPPLYSLKDLLNDPYKGFFYAKQLTKCPAPNFKRDFFMVEKVLAEKMIKKKKYYLVKFLFYPAKFNQYISADNLVVGND